MCYDKNVNKELAEIVTLYAISSHEKLRMIISEKSKDNIIAVLMDLLTLYFNDKNSSTLRQFLLVTLSGYEMNAEKIGYNGYKQISIGTPMRYCEAKPKNINTNDKKLKKLDGSGNFTDYTWARLKKDLKINPTILAGGFIDGKLIYICEFPFKTTSFTNRLSEQLKKHFPNGYESGRFLRSASFGFKHYGIHPRLKTKIFVTKKELNNRKKFITKQLFSFLYNQAPK